MISIYKDETPDSPVVPTLPDYDLSLTYEEPITVSSSLIYSGSIFIGDDFDTSNMIAYDTGSRLSVIPSASADGWFNENRAGNVTVDTDNEFTYFVDYEAIDCEMAYANVCANDARDLTTDSCAYMGFCLTAFDVFPHNY